MNIIGKTVVKIEILFLVTGYQIGVPGGGHSHFFVAAMVKTLL
jgi:hypothetical protein